MPKRTKEIEVEQPVEEVIPPHPADEIDARKHAGEFILPSTTPVPVQKEE